MVSQIQATRTSASDDNFVVIVHDDLLGRIKSLWVVRRDRGRPAVLRPKGWEDFDEERIVEELEPSFVVPVDAAHVLGLALLGREPVSEKLADVLSASLAREQRLVETLIDRMPGPTP